MMNPRKFYMIICRILSGRKIRPDVLIDWAIQVMFTDSETGKRQIFNPFDFTN